MPGGAEVPLLAAALMPSAGNHPVRLHRRRPSLSGAADYHGSTQAGLPVNHGGNDCYVALAIVFFLPDFQANGEAKMAGAKKARAKKATREIRRTNFKGQRLGKRWVSVVEDILAKDGIKLARQILAQQKSKELASQDFTGEILVRMPVEFFVRFRRRGGIVSLAGDGGVDCVCTHPQEGVCVCVGACSSSCCDGPPIA